jgi:hypothetical protein
VELTKTVVGWLSHNGRIGNKPEFALGYFDELVAERAKGRMENIGGDAELALLVAGTFGRSWVMILSRAGRTKGNLLLC